MSTGSRLDEMEATVLNSGINRILAEVSAICSKQAEKYKVNDKPLHSLWSDRAVQINNLIESFQRVPRD